MSSPSLSIQLWSHVFHSKILRGFDTYQQNTGKRHPSQPDNYKRVVSGAVSVALTDSGEEQLWYGAYIKLTQVFFVLIALQVISLLEPLPSRTPSTLTPQAVTFSFPRHRVALPAMDTKGITHPSPRPPIISESPSISPKAMALP
jgi:hypothetical protein